MPSASVPLPAVPLRLHPGTPVAAAAGQVYYMQEGATLAAENGDAFVTMPTVSATFVLESSVWSIGYEINGLTTTGDWYQGLALDNWPGCGSGFGFAYEVWDATGSSVLGPVCNLPWHINAGDTLTITLSLNCAAGGLGSMCFTFADGTRGTGGTVTVAQPDPTATAFVNGPTAADVNGFFTGPMTEVVDITASSCLAYGSMPTVSYVIAAGGLSVSAYIPWSDEFGVIGSTPFACYSGVGPTTTVDAGPLTAYYESTSGNAYGPHWVAGQNWSQVVGTAGLWRFQTDPSPLAVLVAFTPPSIDLGQSVSAAATVSGGSGTVSCAWAVNGAPASGTSCVLVQTPPSLGSYVFTATVADGLSDYAQGAATLVVYDGPVVPPPVLSHSAVDVGQSVDVTSAASGGSGGLTYLWSGLPAGCDSSTAVTVHCTPPAVGTFHVTVAVTDSSGRSNTSSATTLTVNPALVVTVRATPSEALQNVPVALAADVQGGTPPFTFAWSGLPAGCSAPANAATFSCAPTVTGTFTVSVRVTDDGGASIASSAVLTVGSAIFGMPAQQGAAVLGVTAVIAIVFALGLILLVRRARRLQPPPAVPPQAPPGPPPPPPAMPPPPPGP